MNESIPQGWQPIDGTIYKSKRASNGAICKPGEITCVSIDRYTGERGLLRLTDGWTITVKPFIGDLREADRLAEVYLNQSII